MKTENRFTEVAILDICTPDYFSGYSYPVLQVEVYSGMTNKNLAYQINQAIDCDYEYLVNDYGQSYTEDEIKLFEKFADEVKNNPDQVINLPKSECEFEDECFCDSVYLFLGLCKPVRKYGMQFLNE